MANIDTRQILLVEGGYKSFQSIYPNSVTNPYRKKTEHLAVCVNPSKLLDEEEHDSIEDSKVEGERPYSFSAPIASFKNQTISDLTKTNQYHRDKLVANRKDSQQRGNEVTKPKSNSSLIEKNETINTNAKLCEIMCSTYVDEEMTPQQQRQHINYHFMGLDSQNSNASSSIDAAEKKMKQKDGLEYLIQAIDLKRKLQRIDEEIRRLQEERKVTQQKYQEEMDRVDLVLRRQLKDEQGLEHFKR